MRAEPTGWPEWFARNVPVWFGLAVLFGTLLFIAWILVIFAAGQSLASVDERQVRRDCRADALRYCKAAIITLDRSTIIQCMVVNRDKLSAACAKHLWVN